MQHTYTAIISWKNNGTDFVSGKYSRAHNWRFDSGIELDASASPQVVPLPYSRAEAVDPEEAFVAAISRLPHAGLSVFSLQEEDQHCQLHG